LVKEQLESGDCPAHAAEFETSVALAAFPENVHWEGVDPEGHRLSIQNTGYAEREPRYFRAARDLANPTKGRVMIDAATRWVISQMRDMLS
jgi:creatinine amidohydrolase/Fe(II)-dependent formamide hydrolase-like protein